MSTLKADAVTAAQTNTSITVKGAGSGIVKLGDGELKFPDADGSGGQFIKTDGSAQLSFATAGGGAWNVVGTAVASNSASLTITGLDSTYDTYAIALSDVLGATDDTGLFFRVGDSGGVDSGSTDYAFMFYGDNIYDASFSLAGVMDNEAAEIRLGQAGGGFSIGNATGEGIGAMLFLHRPGDGTMKPTISGTATHYSNNGTPTGMSVFGSRLAVITLDRVSILFAAGNITSGRMTVWGIAHA